MTDYTSTPTEPTPTFGRERKRPSWIRRNWIPITALVVTFALGTAIGAAGKSPTADAVPLPAKTIEVEVAGETKTVEVEVTDPLCKAVALELFDQLSVMNSDVVLPLSEGGSEGIGAILDGDYDGADVAIAKINGATTALQGLTARVEALGPDYLACTQ
jgi:hypothetical protein